MAVFFVSCPLNYENHLVEEMKTFWFEMMDLDGMPTREPLPEFSIEAGGVEMKVPEHIGYQLNFFSKIAHRILIRIHSFESRFYDQFEREMKVVPLPKWIPKCQIKIKIETVKSRLNHERNLLEVCDRVLPPLGYTPVHAEDADHQLFIRIVKDRTTLSLDTSGEHLHRRGYAVYRGEAPLRENLAALVDQIAVQSGFDSNTMTLVDPFAGSGTMIFEMASLRQPNFKRDFAWLHFLNKPKIFNSESWVKNFRWLQTIKKLKAVAVEIDEKSVTNIEKNKVLFSEMYPQVQLDLKVIHQDSSQLKKTDFDVQQNYWLVSNPPYGIRLKNDAVPAMFTHVESLIPLKGALILHPESMRIQFNRLKLSSEIDFANQGLNIKMSQFSS
ncbi:MAG: hypothetical protein H7256_07470 [Bdellovibrio sp.]|nr:hypothetical protein [Bdellovibrio sp.]